MARRPTSPTPATHAQLMLRVLALAWIALALTLASLSARGQSDPPGSVPEYQLKAAFLERFRAFVHWPATHDPAQPKPAVLGIVGRNPFGPRLPLAGKQPGGDARALRLVECTTPEDTLDCDIVFFCNASSELIATTLRVLAHHPILTVGETAEFARAGGMISMVPADRRIRLEINPARVARTGLRIDPQLLQLATIVQDKDS